MSRVPLRESLRAPFAVCVLALLVAWLALPPHLVIGRRSPEEPLDDYPELDDAEPLPTAKRGEDGRLGSPGEILGWLRDHGEDARSIARGLVETYHEAAAEPGVRFSITITSDDSAFEDEMRHCGKALAALADSRVDPVLLRIARDTDIEEEGRAEAVVGLCRKGAPPGTVAGLAAVALDPQAPSKTRLAVLRRFPRLGVAPPASMRRLLDEPFHGLDLHAAKLFPDAATPPPSTGAAVPADLDALCAATADEIDPAVASVLLLHGPE